MIDESGDCGFKFDRGSSRHFVITAIIFQDSFSAEAYDRNIDELRSRLKLAHNYEFHFRKCRDILKRKFLSQIASDEFRYHAFVIDKQRLFSSRFLDSPSEFYSFAASIVCDNARPLLKDAKVIIDKNGDRDFRQRLARSVKQKLADPYGVSLIKKVVMEHSHSNNLVQVADMVCGAIARKFNVQGKATDEFSNLIRNQMARIQFWPKETR